MIGSSSPPLPTLLKVLAEPVRLRALALLELEELAVGELSRALAMAQSRVSNHLRVLREAGLLVERHVGKTIFLRSAVDRGADAWVADLWQSVRVGLSELPEHDADRLRLADLLAARPGAHFFDALAGDWDKVGELFRTGVARERAASALLPPDLVLADLGCGTGYVARALLGRAARMVCVDRSAGMLARARERLTPAPPGTTLDFRRGELDALPIDDDELDGALLGLVLHHLDDLDGPLREVRRAVRPSGAVVVLELAPHRQEWMQRSLGDRHLGLDSGDVTEALRRAGFVDIRLEDVDDRYCPRPPEGDEDVALPLYIVRGRVPSGRHA